MKLPLLETNMNKLQKDGFFKIINLLSSNYKGLQLKTTSGTKFSEIEILENVMEYISSLINIGTYLGRVTLCKLVAQL